MFASRDQNLNQILMQTMVSLANQYLRADPEQARTLHTQTGKIIQLHLLPRYGSWCFKIAAPPAWLLLIDDQAPADVMISATPLALLQWRQDTAPDITITGDVALAQLLKNVFMAIEIDWQSYCAKLLGDTVAVGMTKKMTALVNWHQQAKASLYRQVGEYLQEELQHLPPRQALIDFYQDVDHLRDEVERLAAQLENLYDQ